MTTYASTSRVQLAYAIETLFGVTPSVGDHRALRFTGESLNFNLNKETSEEINEYRGSSSMIAVSAEASGSINGEMQFSEYDKFISATLQGSWEGFGTEGVGTAFDGEVTATTIVATAAPTGTDAFTNLKTGQWFMLGGAYAGPNKGKLLRVHSTTAPTADTITLDPGTPALPEAAATGLQITSSRLTNGVDQRSFSLEKLSSDTGEYFLYRGMTPSSMNLNIAQSARSTVEFAFMGRDSVGDTATALPGAKQPSQGHQIMSGVDGTTCALWYGGTPLTGTSLSSLALSYDNALRMQNALCSLGAVGIGSGTIAVSVNVEAYFASGREFYDEFLTNQNKELAFTSFDVDGNGYVFTLPKANVSTYSVTAGSKDADLMASITLTGLMDLSTSDIAKRGKVLIIDRIGAPLVTG